MDIYEAYTQTIKLEKKINESIASDDKNAFKNKVDPRAVNAINEIDATIKTINREMSEFNSPGAKVIFRKAICNAFSSNGDFNVNQALQTLNKYR